jgi:hypothetical protein
VNAVCPGRIDTPFARSPIGDEKDFEVLSKSLPIGRVGKPEEIASVLLWLCSLGASYVIGHALVVDGGHSLGGQLRPASRKEIYNSIKFGRLPVSATSSNRLPKESPCRTFWRKFLAFRWPASVHVKLSDPHRCLNPFGASSDGAAWINLLSLDWIAADDFLEI